MRNVGPTSTVIERLAQLCVADETARRLGIGGRLRLRRAWPRSSGYLLLEFVDESGRLVPGQWMDDARELASIGDETLRRCPGASVVLEAVDRGAVLLQPRGADRRLHHLRGLVARGGASLVVHRPERRAVVRLDEPNDVRFAKLVRRSRVADLVEGARVIGRLERRAFAVPEIREVDTKRGIITCDAVDGASLFDLLANGTAAVTAAAAAGEAVRSMHQAIPPSGRTHDAEDEQRVLRHWLDLLRAFDPAACDEVLPVAEDVCRAMTPAGAAQRLIHRDLHDKQVFCGPTGVSILDLDTWAVGEPALDVANMVAHFELRALQGRCTPRFAIEMAGAFMASYEQSSSGTTYVGAYLDAARVRLACVYSFRPAWRHLLPGLIERVGAPWDQRIHSEGMIENEAQISTT